MATITIVNASSGVRIRALSTGGYGNQEATTDRNGEVKFSDSANRIQVQFWSKNGTRWVNLGDVIQPFKGNIDRTLPF